jgi:hypothetical protein
LAGDEREMIGGRFVTSGNTGGSGTRPERALEAINNLLRAQRESIALPELPCERRSGPAEPNPGTPKLSERPEGKRSSSAQSIQNRKSFPDPASSLLFKSAISGAFQSILTVAPWTCLDTK